MAETFYLATGKRKNAIARVRLKSGSGKIIVNGKEATEYFRRESALPFIEQPLELTENIGKVDIYANIKGGGLSGQAGALTLELPVQRPDVAVPVIELFLRDDK